MAAQPGTAETQRRLWLPEMEGRMARWYARQRGTPAQLEQFRELARRLGAGLQPGARVLEIAPGPGYLAIEFAKLGFAVTGLDISRTMVQIARRNAERAGLRVDFRHGDATALPFDGESFDVVVCQAAFKNFRHPLTALDEMHRVLRPGGTAVIEDLNRDASRAAIRAEVEKQELGGVAAAINRLILGVLRRRAYSSDRFEELAAASSFGRADVDFQGVGLEVWLRKAAG